MQQERGEPHSLFSEGILESLVDNWFHPLGYTELQQIKKGIQGGINKIRMGQVKEEGRMSPNVEVRKSAYQFCVTSEK